jgi:hypothetical protein
LLLEEISPSPHLVIASACLRALSNLTAHLKSEEGRREAVQAVLSQYTGPERPAQLRAVAAGCLLEVEGAGESGLPALLREAVRLYREERTEAVRASILEAVLGLLGEGAPLT